MRHETSKNKLTANIGNVLLVTVLFMIVFSGAYQFGKNINKDMQQKKEVDSLTTERLKLEIELKRLELSRKNSH